MKKIAFILVVGLLTACAIQVAPTGGEKDIIPPQVLNEKPESGTTNFDKDQIEITFDEFVKLDRLKEQLIVSPPLKYSLTTSIRGKTLKLKIKDTLVENATYVMNFGNAIVDIRENNPLENYTYVFSTSSEIDSGYVKGRVIEAFARDAAENVLIMAYADRGEDMDSIPYLERPDYVSRSREDGSFVMNFMKEGSYKLFALEDGNDNFLFDRPTERIAFLEDKVNSTEGVDTVEFFLFEEDHEKQFVKEQIERGPSTLLIFNREVDSISISTELLDSIEFQPLIEEFSAPNDSFKVWWPNEKLRLPLIVHADTLIDTLKIKVDTVEVKTVSPLRIGEFGPHHYYQAPLMRFTYPIASIDTSKMYLLDADSNQLQFELKAFRDSRTFQLIYPRKEASGYVFSVDSAAFTDIYGFSNDSVGYGFTLDEESDFGSLTIRLISDREEKMILQLLTGKRIYIKEVALDSKEYTFEHLKSGTFSLKLIIDENGNGKWDTGNYLEGVQAEEVIDLREEIRIRSRWSKEIDWVLDD